MTELTTNEKKKTRGRTPNKAPDKSAKEPHLGNQIRVLNSSTKINSRVIDEHYRYSQKRFDIVNERIRAVDQSIDKRAKKQVDLQINRIQELKNVAKLINSIDGLQVRIDDLGERVRFMIHKETVLTEVSRFARDKRDWLLLAQFHLAVMRAFDQDNEWWALNAPEMLIGEWFDKIMNLLEE